jgi:CBS domain-containing membrane protein
LFFEEPTLNIEEIMTPTPERVLVVDSIADAINKLFELDVRHLPVVDENGELVGMLSDRDLRSYSLPYAMEYTGPDEADERTSAPVSDVMQGDVISVGTDADISEVISLMIDHKVGAIPVVDSLEGGLVGIVSYIDVLRLAEEELTV